MWGCPLSFYLRIPTLLQFYVGLPSVILSMNPYSTPVLCGVALCHSIYESLLYSSSMWGCPLSFYLWIPTLLQFYVGLPSVILSMNPYSTPVLCGVALCHSIYESLLYSSSMWGCPLSFYLWIPTLLQFYVRLPSVILSMNPYSTPVLCGVALCHSIYESLLYSSSMWGCPLSFYLWIPTLLQFYVGLPSVILSMNPYSTPVLCEVALCHSIYESLLYSSSMWGCPLSFYLWIPTLLQFYVRLPSVILSMNPYSTAVLCGVALCHSIYESLLYSSSMWGCPLSFYLWIPTLLQFYVGLPSVILSMNPYSTPVLCGVALCHSIYESLLYSSSMWGCPLSFYLWIPTLLQFYVGLPSVILSMNPYSTPVLCEVALCHSIYESLLYSSSMWGCPLSFYLWIPTLLQFYVGLPSVILSMNPYSTPVLCEVALCHSIYESLLYSSSMWGCPLSFYLWLFFCNIVIKQAKSTRQKYIKGKSRKYRGVFEEHSPVKN